MSKNKQFEAWQNSTAHPVSVRVRRLLSDLDDTSSLLDRRRLEVRPGLKIAC